MTWEWDSHSTPHRWALTVGSWNAVVQRTSGPRPRWHAAIENAGAPDDRLDGPACQDAIAARTWCLAKIAELQAKRPRAS
jgi:hypothetical protein